MHCTKITVFHCCKSSASTAGKVRTQLSPSLGIGVGDTPLGYLANTPARRCLFDSIHLICEPDFRQSPTTEHLLFVPVKRSGWMYFTWTVRYLIPIWNETSCFRRISNPSLAGALLYLSHRLVDLQGDVGLGTPPVACYVPNDYRVVLWVHACCRYSDNQRRGWNKFSGNLKGTLLKDVAPSPTDPPTTRGLTTLSFLISFLLETLLSLDYRR